MQQGTERRKMHVLHIVRKGFAGGGMENGIINVANRLPADRYKVSICALDSSETFSQAIHREDPEYYVLPPKPAGVDWMLVGKLAKVIRQSKADLVHSHNWGTFLYAVLAAKWAGVPVVHGEHGKNIGELEGESGAKRLAKSILGRRLDRLVTVSQEIATEWATYGIPTERVLNIPNGVDEQRFRPRIDSGEQRLRFALPKIGFVIGSIGRMDELKNYDLLLDAFATLAAKQADTYLALLGEGPLRAHLESKSFALGIGSKVFFPGRKPDPENFLATLDVFVLPSKTEGMSNVVLEAMSSGLPVICADLPCHAEVFRAGAEGLTVSPCTAENMSGELERVYANPALREKLGTAARKKILARFTIDRMVADYGRLYASILGVEAAGVEPAPNGDSAKLVKAQ